MPSGLNRNGVNILSVMMDEIRCMAYDTLM